MKLPKESLMFIFEQLILFKNYSTDRILRLKSHIEALEQELAAKSRFVALARYLVNYGEAGTIYEVTANGDQFVIISGKHEGETFHKSHAHEIDINQTFTELKQENLQRLEEVKGLQRQVKNLTEWIDGKNGKLRRLREDLSKAWAAHNAEREARVLMEATLERAMLDHQPVVLPREVAEAVKFYRSYKFDNADIYEMGCEGTDGSWALSINNWLKRNGSKSSFMAALVNGYTVEPEKIVLSNELDKAIKYALDTHWYKGNPEYLLKVHRELKLNASFWHSELSALNNISTELLEKALFEGYTVEQSPEDPAIKEVAAMLNKWADGDYVTDISVDEQNKEFAKEIIDCVKAHSK